MNVELPFGRNRLTTEVPHRADVLAGPSPAPVQHVPEAIGNALDQPVSGPTLRDILIGKPDARIVVAVPDITRPMPRQDVLETLLDRLEAWGADPDCMTIVIATGMHRPSTPAQREEMFGRRIVKTVRIEDHRADFPDVVATVPGTSLKVNRTYLEADVKIVAGLVEPHFMAGYSGGRKTLCPGLMTLKGIENFHGPKLLSDPNSRAGLLDGNPCHAESLANARSVGCDFCINVFLTEDRRIAGVTAGELDASHRAAVEKLAEYVTVSPKRPADVVLVGCGGYPLDQTFYQCVKGLCTAAQVVRKGGVIIAVGHCGEGIGGPVYRDIMFRYNNDWRRFLTDIHQTDAVQIDQWEYQMHCRVLEKVGVEGIRFIADGISRKELSRLSVTPGGRDGQTPTEQLREELDRALKQNPNGRIGILPDGPYVVVDGDR